MMISTVRSLLKFIIKIYFMTNLIILIIYYKY